MTIKFSINMVRSNRFNLFMVLFTAFFFSSLGASAQEQRPFVAHEVIEIGGGQKIEILRCRGEGPVEECDCIYYTDKRQNGKRQWQNANQIRQEQKSAQLEVAAAKELAKTEAQKMAEARTKEAAERKAAKEKERTASSETNEVIETIKEQNNEIKSKGAVKANAYRGSAAVAKKKEMAAETKKAAMSLKEIARQRDSINRSKMPKQDEVVADSESETPTVDKAEVKATPEKPVKVEEPKTQPVITKSEEKEMTDTAGVVDFETLRKLEEAHGNTSYEPPVKSATEEKSAPPVVTKPVETEKSPTPEEAPVPKPAKAEEPMVDTSTKALMVDTLQSGGNIPVPPTDTIVSPADTDTTTNNSEAVEPVIIQTETSGNAEESLKETMKEEMSKAESTETKADENVKKKEKKEKKAKKEKKSKKKTEEDPAVETPPTETPVEDAPLTPLQKAAKEADSVIKSKSETDTTTTPAPEEKKDFGANRKNKYNNATQRNNVAVDSTSSEALEANKTYIYKKKLIRISGRV